jgi:PAS domain-containing protein
MTRSLNPQQVVLLLGTALVIGAVLILAVYALHRSMRRRKKEMRLTSAAPPVRDESAFLLTSLQGLVATLKSREKQLEALLREAEQRADASLRALETLVRASPQGLMVFDHEGFLTQANQAARNILEVDTFARRRYGEIFGADSPFSQAVRSCLEKAGNTQQVEFCYASASGRRTTLGLLLSPFHGRGGKLAGLVCIVTVLAGPPAPHARLPK